MWCVEGLNAKAMNVKKSLAILFVLVFLLHVAVILVLEKVDVGLSVITGEVVEYQEQAEITASRISEGNFSIHNLGLDHYFPVLVGYLYFVFGPHVVVGQLFNAAIAGVSAILLFALMRQVGGTKKLAFIFAMAASSYPTYLLFTSLFYEDALAIVQVLANAS